MGDFNVDLGDLDGPMACTHINEQGKILYRDLTKWNFISTHYTCSLQHPPTSMRVMLITLNPLKTTSYVLNMLSKILVDGMASDLR